MAAPKIAGSLMKVVQEALPGAGFVSLFGLITGGPKDALKYGLTDLAVNVPALGLARKLAPGTKGIVNVLDKAGKPTGKTKPFYAPSAVETTTNLVASMLSPVAAEQLLGAGMTPTDMSQEQQLYMQARQRQVENGLQTQALAPGTQFQMQGLPNRLAQQLGVEAPEELRAYLRSALGENDEY